MFWLTLADQYPVTLGIPRILMNLNSFGETLKRNYWQVTRLGCSINSTMGAQNSVGYRSRVRFGPYEADFDSGELRKHGVKIKLQEQPLRILRSLVDQPGQFISREQLIRELWPEGTFVDYDHSLNVGVARLRQALADSADSPRYIETLGRKGYRFIADIELPAAPVVSSASRKSRSWMALVSVTIVLTAIFLYINRTARKPGTNRVVPLTSYPGRQTTPAFSHDGKQVAFSWDCEEDDNFDIYVKVLDAGDPLRLTRHAAAEYFPAWSPDDRYIAFIRSMRDHFEIWMVPALGGVERRLGESFSCKGLSWSPDGRFLVLVDQLSPQAPNRLVLLTVENGEKRTLTSPPGQYFGDLNPKFSPDGRSIAFRRASSPLTADLTVLAVNADGTTRGDPQRITSRERVFDLDWTADGKTIVFLSDRSGRIGLWTIPASGGVPERLTPGSDNAVNLSVSRTGNHLVYVRSLSDINIWRVAGPKSNRNSPATKLIASTWLEGEPQYSPDGKKIVFNSDRSSQLELWTCDGEGRGCGQLTSLRGPAPGSPRWSPDSRWIAFDCPQAGKLDIYVISANGGPVHRVTTGPSNNMRASWSRDGQWIYFGSNRTGEWQVWKSPKEGGRAIQVTRANGAAEAVESPDGKFLYYARLDRPGIWKFSLQDGQETKVLDQGRLSLWALSDDGISFFDLAPHSGPALKFYSFAKQQTLLLWKFAKGTKIPELDRPISVATDEQWILYTQFDHVGS